MSDGTISARFFFLQIRKKEGFPAIDDINVSLQTGCKSYPQNKRLKKQEKKLDRLGLYVKFTISRKIHRPNTMKTLVPLCIVSVALLAQSALGQNATTTPVGVMTIDFPATGTSPASTSKYFGLPLHNDATFTGQPTAVAPDTLTFSGVNWTTSPSQFGATPATFIARILTGQQAGRILQVVSNTSNSITVSITDRSPQSTALDYSGFSVTTSDSVEIVPADTLSGIFGDGSAENPLVTNFVGTVSAYTADTVSVFERSTGLAITYFFYIPNGGQASQGQWRRSNNGTNANLVPIYPDDCIMVLRRTNRLACQLVLPGRVPTVAPLIKAYPGRSYLTTLGVPVDVTLSGLSFSGAWTRNNSAYSADSISVYSQSLRVFVPYFQRSDNNTWRSSASTAALDVSTSKISADSAVNVLERPPTQVGAASFNKFSLPYSL